MNNINHTALFKELMRILSISLAAIVFAIFNIYLAEITSVLTAVLASLFILVSVRSLYLASTLYYKFYHYEASEIKKQNYNNIQDNSKYNDNKRPNQHNQQHNQQNNQQHNQRNQ